MSIEVIMAQSPTPRTHSIWNALVNAGSNPVETGRILGAARKMELELKAANDRIKRLEEALEECDWAFTKFCPEHESRYGDAWEKVRDALNRPNPFKPYWPEENL